MPPPVKVLQHTVLAAEAGRLDSLVARLLNFSRARVRGLVGHGGVAVNDQDSSDPGTLLRPGDRVTLTYDPERRYREAAPLRPAAAQGFTVVYLDEHLVVVDKRAGILTVPTPRDERNTLVDRLSSYLAKGQSRRPKVSVVHRLDRDTSGLLVFGRSPDVARQIIAQFAAHKPEREYAALVAGAVADDIGTIRSHLVSDKALNQRSVEKMRPAASGRGRAAGGRTMGEGGARPELAVTHYRVLARYGDATLVAVNLETGRRNQIRVHFAERGQPVLGDARYEVATAAHRAWPYKRLALHARILGFRHPVDGRALRFESELPREFGSFAAAQRR